MAEMESRRVRVTLRVWMAKVELTALMTEPQAGIWKTTVESEQQRTKVEPGRGRSPMEPEGQRDGVKPRSIGRWTTDQGGAGRMG